MSAGRRAPGMMAGVARVLLVLPTATYRAEAFLRAAARLGVEVVTASERRQALAAVMGDRFLEIPLADPEEAARRIVAHDRRLPLDAVVAVDDQGLAAAARAGQALGLRTNPPAAVAVTRDKAAMRRLFSAAELPQPAYQVVQAGTTAELAAAAAAASAEIGPPVVVKPTGLSASRGVIRADSPAEAAAAAARTGALLEHLAEPSRLIVERYIPGEEVALEGLLERGRLHVLALFDKPDPLVGPYFEETIYVTPSRHPTVVQRAVAASVAAATAALGLVEGPIHAELRLEAHSAGIRPVVLEVAARTIGGRCAAALRFAAGTSLEEIVLRHALGEPVGDALDTPLRAASGVMMLPIPASGRLVAVEGRAEAEAVPGISAVEIAIPLGQHVDALPEGNRYLGFLFARAGDPAAVEEALRAAQGALEIRIEPAPPHVLTSSQACA